MNMTRSPDQQGELLRYIEVLWARKLTVLVTVGVLVMAAVLGSAVKADTPAGPGAATSVAEILVRSMPGTLDGQSVAPNLETERRVLGSPATLDPALNRTEVGIGAGDARSGLSVELISGTEVLRVSVSSSDAREAEDVLQAVVDEYVTTRNEQARSILAGFEQVLESRRGDLVSALERLERRITQAAAEGNRMEARALQSQRSALFLRLDGVDDQLASVRSRRYEQFGATVLQSPTTTVSSEAAESESRSLVSTLGLALALGLLLGAAIALFQAFLDRRLYTRSEVESSLGLPVLGVLPATEKRGSRDWESSIPKVAAAVIHALRGVDSPILALTSPSSETDLGAVSTCLASSLSRSGSTALLTFGSSAIDGMKDPALEILKIEDSERNDVHSLLRATEELQGRKDWVVVEAPSTAEADGVLLAAASTAVLLVLCAGLETEQAVSESVAEIRAAGGNPVGVVLTSGPMISRRL